MKPRDLGLQNFLGIGSLLVSSARTSCSVALQAEPLPTAFRMLSCPFAKGFCFRSTDPENSAGVNR
jgi:hypothetical protein